MNEQKPFEYIELKAIGMLCAAHTTMILTNEAFKDADEGRKMIENEVEKILRLSWDRPDKKPL